MRRVLGFLAALMVMAPVMVTVMVSAAWADPVGRYAVQGTNPDGQSGYQGTVEVTRKGEAYFVRWQIGAQSYQGSAIGGRVFGGQGRSGAANREDTMLVVSFGGGVSYMYLLEGTQDFAGHWVSDGGDRLGEEIWTRQ